MVNSVFLNDKILLKILNYISKQRQSHQIRMMFFCSLNGMRSINFTYLQIKDVYTSHFSVRDVIYLNGDKNKGKNRCSYYLNEQIKQEFKIYLQHLKDKNNTLTPETYLFVSQKTNKPYHRVSVSRLFARIYRHFGIEGASHLGRHLFVSRLVNAGVNICIVQKLVNHKHLSTTQLYFNSDEKMLKKAVKKVEI